MYPGPRDRLLVSSCYRLLDTLLVKSTCAEGPWKGCIRYVFILHAILLHGIMSLSRSRVIRCLKHRSFNTDIAHTGVQNVFSDETQERCIREMKRELERPRDEWRQRLNERTLGKRLYAFRRNSIYSVLMHTPPPVSAPFYVKADDGAGQEDEQSSLPLFEQRYPTHARQSRYRGEHRERVCRARRKALRSRTAPFRYALRVRNHVSFTVLKRMQSAIRMHY